MENRFILEIPNDIRAIERAVEVVVGRCRCGERKVRRFRLNFRVALAEALSNAMLYGNGPDPAKRVRVHVSATPNAVTARVIDQGQGFDPTKVEDPTTPENITRNGGRGLFLMRQLLDEVRYNDRGNIVTLVLRLDEEGRLGEAYSA